MNTTLKSPPSNGENMDLALVDYHCSKLLANKDIPVAALIAAAMRRGDSLTSERLKMSFPKIWDDLSERYNEPYGITQEELNRIHGSSQENSPYEVHQRALGVAKEYLK